VKNKKIVYLVLATLVALGQVRQAVCVKNSRGIAPDVVFVFPGEETSLKSDTSHSQDGPLSLLQEKMCYRTIRVARPADLPAIKRIFCENFGESFYNFEQRLWMVLVVRGEVKGFAQYDALCGCNPELYYLAIARDVRRQGHARRLLGEVCKDLLCREVESVSLQTDLDNAPAQKLYEKFGFELVKSWPKIVEYTLKLKTWAQSCKGK
jgi:GNAT superfamily N-acetyltransferase